MVPKYLSKHGVGTRSWESYCTKHDLSKRKPKILHFEHCRAWTESSMKSTDTEFTHLQHLQMHYFWLEVLKRDQYNFNDPHQVHESTLSSNYPAISSFTWQWIDKLIARFRPSASSLDCRQIAGCETQHDWDLSIIITWIHVMDQDIIGVRDISCSLDLGCCNIYNIIGT